MKEFKKNHLDFESFNNDAYFGRWICRVEGLNTIEESKLRCKFFDGR